MALPLYDFQKIGARFLADRTYALLGDEMGIGKTAQAIHAADLIKARRIIVVCPAIAKINWQREFEKFSDVKRDFKIVETKKDKWKAHQSLILSFEMVSAMHLDLIPVEPYDLLIVDESHFLKSLESKRTQAILARKNGGLICMAKRAWFLSGTPCPNHIGEMWPLFFTLGVTDLSHARFIHIFCTSYIFQGRVTVTGTRIEKTNDIRKMFEKIMLRRKKVDVLPELPEITFQEIRVPKGKVDIEIDSSFVKYVFPIDRREELVETLEKEERDVEAVLIRLKDSDEGMQALEAIARSVSTLRRYRGLQKVESVIGIVSEELRTNAYEKVVIFGIHQGVIELLRDGLREFHPVTLYGGTPDSKRQSHIDKFQKDAKTRVFIANIQAAGPSITLTRAHNIIFIEQDWVPGNNAQAAMRCHRIGQKNAVLVRTISLDDPIDERISSALRRKTAQLLQIVG